MTSSLRRDKGDTVVNSKLKNTTINCRYWYVILIWQCRIGWLSQSWDASRIERIQWDSFFTQLQSPVRDVLWQWTVNLVSMPREQEYDIIESAIARKEPALWSLFNKYKCADCRWLKIFLFLCVFVTTICRVCDFSIETRSSSPPLSLISDGEAFQLQTFSIYNYYNKLCFTLFHSQNMSSLLGITY